MLTKLITMTIDILHYIRETINTPAVTVTESTIVEPPKKFTVGVRSWFTYKRTDMEGIEAVVYSDNSMGLRIYYGKEWISTKVSAESADKITQWLLKQYPHGGTPNAEGSKATKKLAKLVSIPGGKTNSGKGTRPPRGKLE